jgi:hypothetical protein
MGDKQGEATPNEHQIRSMMILRSQSLSNIGRTLGAIIHDAQLLERQLNEERAEWERLIEASLHYAERKG